MKPERAAITACNDSSKFEYLSFRVCIFRLIFSRLMNKNLALSVAIDENNGDDSYNSDNNSEYKF